MAEWIQPIYDRTSADVTRAKLKVKEWIEAIVRGEEVDIIDLKGYFNAIDINRIENNTDYLNLSAGLDLTIKMNWERTELPNQSDITRIIDNINDLVEEFGFQAFVQDMPTTILTYRQVNTIERNLTIIKNLLEDMSARIKAIFDKIDTSISAEVAVALTLPLAKSDLDKIDTEARMKAVNAAGIPFEAILDSMLIVFTAPTYNGLSVPAKFETNIEVALLGRLTDSTPKLITARLWGESDLTSEFINSASTLINVDYSIIKSDVEAVVGFLPSYFIKLLENITVNMLTDLVCYSLSTNLIKAESEVIADLQNIVFSFANMFVKGKFSLIRVGLSSEIFALYSNKVNGEVLNETTFTSIVKLYACSKLSEYDLQPLSFLDNKTLKDLAYSEIL